MTARAAAVPLVPGSALALLVGSLLGVAALGWPLLTPVRGGAAHAVDGPFVFALVLPVLVLILLAELTGGRLDSKALAMLGVLSALGAAARPLGAGIAGIETVFVLIVLGGRVFGPGFGFVLGSTTLFASALLTGGVGPWLPFQMLAASWAGLGAGLLPPLRGRAEVVLLCGFALVAAIGYGLAMNLWFWPFSVGAGTELSYVAGAPLLDNIQRFLVFSAVTSLGWELGRAITTIALVILLGPAILGALRRAARRAAFATPA